MVEGLTLDPTRTERGGLLDTWGSWLSDTWQWDWFVTLTFDPIRDVGGGTHTVVGWSRSQRYWEEWAKWLDERAGGGTYWFRGREPNPDRLGTHFHALVGGVSGLSRREAWAQWSSSHGFSRLLPYGRDHLNRPVDGAASYVAKYVTKKFGDLQFSESAGLYRREVPRDVVSADALPDWGRKEQ